MTQPSEDPKTESIEIDGHVVVIGSRLHADTGRWEPTVSVKPSWSSAPAVTLTTAPQHFQDTPIDAMALARKMAGEWLIANQPDEGTVDAAV